MKFLPAAFLSVLTMATAAQAAEPSAAHFLQFAQEVAAFSRPLPAPSAPGPSALFVGSSSIRLWDVSSSFPAIRAINRGFGGATTADVLHYYREVIAGTTPSSVIVYVGENDIAAGVAPDVVAKEVLTLLAQLRHDMPNAHIVYLSMKPTPARWDLYPHMIAVNQAIRARGQSGGDYDYLDVGSALLTAGGVPNADYFTADRLHMNRRGYALWSAMLDRHLAGMVARAKAVPVVQTTS